MGAKEILQKLPLLQWRIQSKKAQLNVLQDARDNIGLNMDGERVQFGSRAHSRLDEMTVKILDMQNELDDEIFQYEVQKNEAISMIETLEDSRMEKILYYRYVQGKSWDWIIYESDVNYGDRQVYRLHGLALAKLDAGLQKAGD